MISIIRVKLIYPYYSSLILETEHPNFACVGVSFKTRKELIQGVANLKAIPETNDSGL